jgi:hypothetical protein
MSALELLSDYIKYVVRNTCTEPGVVAFAVTDDQPRQPNQSCTVGSDSLARILDTARQHGYRMAVCWYVLVISQ